MGLDDRLGDKKAQTRHADFHRPLVEEAGELAEELRDVFLADPYALVVDRHLGVALLVRKGDDREIPAARRVLHRVGQQVEQGLLPPPPVTPNDQSWLDADAHREAVRIGPEMPNDILDESGQVEALEMVGELIVLDAV